MKITGDPIHFVTTEEWRSWLEENHAGQGDVWVMIYKKHSEIPSVSVDQAVEEALCFGWIDSSMQPIDEDRYALRFTSRRKGSNWSERNKARVAKLTEEGRMTEAGLAEVERAKQSGRWSGR